MRFLIILLICISNIGFAQVKFSVTKGSNVYDANIVVATCAEDVCSGNATITLSDKKSKQIIQSFTSDDLYFFLDKKQPTSNIVELYGEQSPLIFDDFNFDGSEDLAIRNGNNSGYGGPSYDVYVYNITRKKFVISKDLTKLASENLGMFQVDGKRKRIISSTKSGCCWHLTTEYEVVKGKGLVSVHSVEEDATGGTFVVVTTNKLINGKMKKTLKKYRVEEYYK